MKRKFLSTFLAASMVLGATSCGGATEPAATEPSTTEPATTTSNEQIEITFWDGSWNEEAFAKILPLWEAEHPNIKVNAEFQIDKGMSDKYMLALKNGTAPDVMACALDWVTTFGSADLLQPMNDFVTKDSFDTSTYVQGAINTHTINNNLYALPFRSETYSLYYNKDILAEAGYTEPPQTWAEVLEIAEKTNTADHAGFGIPGANYGNVSFVYTTMLRTNGGNILTDDLAKSRLNEQESIETMQLYKDLSAFAPASYLENDNVATRTLFASGKVGMYISGIYDAPEIVKANPNLNFATAMVPVGEGDERHTILGGWSVAVPKTSDEQEAAWEFVKFITRPDIAKLYTNTFTGTGEPAQIFEGLSDDVIKSGADGLQYATALPATPNIVPIRQQMFDSVVSVLTNNETVEEGTKTMSDAVDELVK